MLSAGRQHITLSQSDATASQAGLTFDNVNIAPHGTRQILHGAAKKTFFVVRFGTHQWKFNAAHFDNVSFDYRRIRFYAMKSPPVKYLILSDAKNQRWAR